MKRFVLLAASLGLAAFLPACQNSGSKEAKADANAPQMTAEATHATYTVDPTTYTVPYATTADTPWMRTSTDSTSSGMLTSGDTVYLRTDAPTTGIVSAKTADGRIVFVRRADLRAK